MNVSVIEQIVTFYVGSSLICCALVLICATIRWCTSKLYEVRQYARESKWQCESWINSSRN